MRIRHPTSTEVEAEVFYNVGLRDRGSERGRPETLCIGYGISFQRERPFRGIETHEYVETEGFDLDPSLLPSKGGLLTLELSNAAADDPDIFLAPTLSAQVIEEGDLAYFETPTPGAPNGTGFAGFVDNPLVDHPRSFYDAPFTLNLSAPEATLSYTLDGSEPSLEHGVLCSSGEASLEIETTTLLHARLPRGVRTERPRHPLLPLPPGRGPPAGRARRLPTHLCGPCAGELRHRL